MTRLFLTIFFQVVIGKAVFPQIDFPEFLSANFHQNNRLNLLQSLDDNEVLLLFAPSEKKKSNDIFYPYHPDRNIIYLTGFHQKNCVLLAIKNTTNAIDVSANFLLFVQQPSAYEQLWNGKMPTTTELKNKLGIEVKYLEDFKEVMEVVLHENSKVLTNANPLLDASNFGTTLNAQRLEKATVQHLRKKNISFSEVQLNQKMGKLRAVKSQEEIKAIEEAITFTCKAHKKLNDFLPNYTHEYQIEADVVHTFRYLGADSWAFPSIVGSGPNACILHYINNQREIQKNEMIVVDIGAQYKGYAADITRTYNSSVKFNQQQQIVYDIVLDAQQAAIATLKAGLSFSELYRTAADIIADGLLKHGIISEKSQYRQFFPHGLSHHLGLDVHDLGKTETLDVGNVITVEPGIYIPENSNTDPKWWNIGVRIEDVVLIEENGYLLLSNCAKLILQE